MSSIFRTDHFLCAYETLLSNILMLYPCVAFTP